MTTVSISCDGDHLILLSSACSFERFDSMSPDTIHTTGDVLLACGQKNETTTPTITKHKNKKSKIIDRSEAVRTASKPRRLVYPLAYDTVYWRDNKHLFIKNMVSIRCKMIVRSLLADLGVHDAIVKLGEVNLQDALSPENYEKFNDSLKEFGLELLADKRSVIVEQIRNVIVEMIHYEDELPRVKLSNYLTEKLHHRYAYLSNLFSEVQGTTIEHFVLIHKIERVKELLVYGELTLSEIAGQLHYSSVAHLSAQFKKITGLTPSFFKKMKDKRRNALEDL